MKIPRPSGGLSALAAGGTFLAICCANLPAQQAGPTGSNNTTLSAPAPQPEQKPAPLRLSPGVADVVKLVDAKVDRNVTLAFIRNSSVAYNPTAQEIVALKERGVPEDILTAMLERGGELRGQTEQVAAAAPENPAPPPQDQTQPAPGAPTQQVLSAPAAGEYPAYTIEYTTPTYVYSYPAYYPYWSFSWSWGCPWYSWACAWPYPYYCGYYNYGYSCGISYNCNNGYYYGDCNGNGNGNGYHGYGAPRRDYVVHPVDGNRSGYAPTAATRSPATYTPNRSGVTAASQGTPSATQRSSYDAGGRPARAGAQSVTTTSPRQQQLSGSAAASRAPTYDAGGRPARAGTQPMTATAPRQPQISAPAAAPRAPAPAAGTPAGMPRPTRASVQNPGSTATHNWSERAAPAARAQTARVQNIGAPTARPSSFAPAAPSNMPGRSSVYTMNRQGFSGGLASSRSYSPMPSSGRAPMSAPSFSGPSPSMGRASFGAPASSGFRGGGYSGGGFQGGGGRMGGGMASVGGSAPRMGGGGGGGGGFRPSR